MLGSLDDKVEMRQIEEKLMVDDLFAEQLTIAEDELSEKYLDAELTSEESAQFYQSLINSPDRRQKLTTY